VLMLRDCWDFALFSRRDDGPRRDNRIGEDEGLKQKNQIQLSEIS